MPKTIQFQLDLLTEGPEGLPSPPSVLDMQYHQAREVVIHDFELRYVQRLIERAGGSVTSAARLAGVDRTTLYRLAEKHGTIDLSQIAVRTPRRLRR